MILLKVATISFTVRQQHTAGEDVDLFCDSFAVSGHGAQRLCTEGTEFDGEDEGLWTPNIRHMNQFRFIRKKLLRPTENASRTMSVHDVTRRSSRLMPVAVPS